MQKTSHFQVLCGFNTSKSSIRTAFSDPQVIHEDVYMHFDTRLKPVDNLWITQGQPVDNSNA